MRLRNVQGSRDVIAQSPFVIHNPEEVKGKWKEVFGNEKVYGSIFVVRITSSIHWLNSFILMAS